MSKEMAVILIGLFVILVRTTLGLPGNWQTVLLVIAGVALMVLGFLLRGESIARSGQVVTRRNQELSFVENAPLSRATGEAEPTPTHERGITSLN